MLSLISTEGFDDDEKEYAKAAKWVDIDYLKNNRHACSIDIKDELIAIIEKKIIIADERKDKKWKLKEHKKKTVKLYMT